MEESKYERYESIVYFMLNIATQYCKIGYTTDVRNRLNTAQNFNTDRIILLGTIPGGQEIEKMLHEKFKEDKIIGEWFKLTDQLVEYIEENTTTKLNECPIRKIKGSW